MTSPSGEEESKVGTDDGGEQLEIELQKMELKRQEELLERISERIFEMRTDLILVGGGGVRILRDATP